MPVLPLSPVSHCVPLCGHRASRSRILPAEPVKTAVSAEIEARSEKTPQILLSADVPAPKAEPVAESEPKETDITAEKETQKPAPTQTVKASKPSASSSEPHMGDVRVVNGEKQIYIDGFGWIKDEGGGSIGTTVGNPIDELTGNKVGIMGGGTFAADMYENGHKIGSMRGEDVPARESIPEPSVLPEPTGDEIHIVLIEVPDKNSTLPPDKPGTTPPTNLVP